MPTVTNENAMATNDADEPDKDDGESKSPVPYASPSTKNAKPAFFTIYKKGQGKWTRLGTVFVAGLLGILTAFNLYHYVLPYLPVSENGNHTVLQILLAVCVGFLLVFGLLTFWVTNKPGNVDFLIATDSEMKKVNWTTQGELIGSTRVVVLFLFFIALFLASVDFVFAEFFRLIHVLQF
jgi:preprotein translocase SecE subunit